jgi:hypothetical protein
VKLIRAALAVAREALPAYSHRYSPKKFTQHQLFACLVLKEFQRSDYRGVETLLRDDRVLRAALELTEVPHFTTLAKAMKRLLRVPTVRELLDATLLHARRRRLLAPRIEAAAIDSSGFEAQLASAYFVKRRAKNGLKTGVWQTTTYRTFPKLAIVADTASHFILSATTHRGPAPDFDLWQPTLDEATRRLPIKRLLADAGFDAEWIHAAARLVYGVRMIIPAEHGRPSAQLPSGYYRRRMTRAFSREESPLKKHYARRGQVETVFSMLKRRLGSALNARNNRSQARAMLLKALVHNIMILRRSRFSTEPDILLFMVK